MYNYCHSYYSVFTSLYQCILVPFLKLDSKRWIIPGVSYFGSVVEGVLCELAALQFEVIRKKLCQNYLRRRRFLSAILMLYSAARKSY